MFKIIKTLKGEFVTAQTVKEANQKDYNQSTWENTVDRYSKYDDVKFLQVAQPTESYYPYNYYVTYIADGIRFMREVSYSSSISSNGFAYGFITHGMKDKDAYKKVIEIMPELKDCDKDSFTVMSFDSNKRLPNNKAGRDYMRGETKLLQNRFYTNDY